MPTTPRNRLGDLERAVMEELWTTAEAHPEGRTVREVHDAIGVDRGLAYTTLMTVLDRMAKKGLVHRERDGRAWRYTAGVDPRGADVGDAAPHAQRAGRRQAAHRAAALPRRVDGRGDRRAQGGPGRARGPPTRARRLMAVHVAGRPTT